MIEWVSCPSSNGKENTKLKCQKRSYQMNVCQTAEVRTTISNFTNKVQLVSNKQYWNRAKGVEDWK